MDAISLDLGHCGVGRQDLSLPGGLMPSFKQVPSLIVEFDDTAFAPRATGRDLARPDLLSMSAEQQHDEVRRLIREAHAAQNQLIHATVRRLLLWVCGAAIVVGNAIRRLAMRLAAALIRYCHILAVRWQRMRAAAELGAMSDRELKDLGVDRSSIDWVVAHGRGDRPSSALGSTRPVLVQNPVSARPPATSALSDAAKQKRRAA
jgi:uncharacterized protein YjiS (DUF1127 family)